MNYSSASGSSIHATVNLIMAAKPLDVIVGQPTTATMDKMTEQMAQMVAPVKTTTWGGLHGSLALVLDNADYKIITKAVVKSTMRLGQPALVNSKISNTTSQLNLLTLQTKTKRLQKEFNLQETVTIIGVQRIINSVKEQYVEELNEEYFGYANQTIKTIINHLRTNWCKVMMKECTNATKAFYHAWVPNTTHIITFGCQLTKLQKKCKTINVIISEEAKTLHFVGQMYKSNYFTKE
jgi:pectate lyase